MTAPPIARQPRKRPFDDPRLPVDLRWYLKISAYVRDPLALRRKPPMSTAGRYALLTPDDEARMAPALLEYLTQCEQALLALGFAPPVRGVNRGFPNLRSCFTLVEHPRDGSIGFVHVAENTRLEGRYAATATFRSDFVDGVQVATTNSQQVSRTPPRPTVDTLRLPQLHDAAALYDVHRFRAAQRERHVALVPLTRAPDPIAFEERQAARVHEFWVRAGYYERVAPDALRLTRRGAVLAAWRGLFPWRQITDWRQERRSRAVMRRYRHR